MCTILTINFPVFDCWLHTYFPWPLTLLFHMLWMQNMAWVTIRHTGVIRDKLRTCSQTPTGRVIGRNTNVTYLYLQDRWTADRNKIIRTQSTASNQLTLGTVTAELRCTRDTWQLIYLTLTTSWLPVVLNTSVNIWIKYEHHMMDIVGRCSSWKVTKWHHDYFNPTRFTCSAAKLQ